MYSSYSQIIRHSNDIASVSVSVCNKYMQTQHVFHLRFYVFATQQSFQQGKYLNLKTCKSINLPSDYSYLYGQSLQTGEILRPDDHLNHIYESLGV